MTATEAFLQHERLLVRPEDKWDLLLALYEIAAGAEDDFSPKRYENVIRLAVRRAG